ncbi:MAG: GIY-YIG nuclease family protein [Planctomycetota bacterium]|nr:GIY-YIG nuclease family protein [Planctomycetota bacterium]
MAKKKTKEAAFTDDDDALLAELGVETEIKQDQTYTAKQERIIAGFEDIQRYYREHERLPQHGEGRDIFERLYALRLDRIRGDAECLDLLRPMDADGILTDRVSEPSEEYELDSDDELLEALGVSPEDNDITTMKHVRSAAERNAERNVPEEVAQRKPCADFDAFRLDFEAVQADLETGRQSTELFKTSSRSQIRKGDWFIVDGQKALVAETGEWFTPEHGERDRRLRVIFDNGTESDLLLRSLRRALNKDENSRRIVPQQAEIEEDFSDLGPLFSNVMEDGDCESGAIYVARSLSDNPFVQENRELLHKIGLTTGDPEKRVSNAKKETTYLFAAVELVAVYRLANINCKAFESLLHKFLARARIDLALADRFGGKVQPREWFLVPLQVVEQVVERIKDGSISDYVFDMETASMKRRGNAS